VSGSNLGKLQEKGANWSRSGVKAGDFFNFVLENTLSCAVSFTAGGGHGLSAAVDSIWRHSSLDPNPCFTLLFIFYLKILSIFFKRLDNFYAAAIVGSGGPVL
jgi:hypothetical protein